MSRSVVNEQRLSELTLLDAVLQGDDGAFKRFFQQFNCLVEMCVRKTYRGSGLSPSGDDVRDMVAEIWLFILDNDMNCLRRFDRDRHVRLTTWIGLLTRNKTIDRLRTSKTGRLQLLTEELLDERACTRMSAVDEIEIGQRVDLAQRAIARLKDWEQEFLEAWYGDELEPEELATRFDVALGTVYSRRFKIQAKLARTVNRLTRAPTLA
jgi:RNA polymerase sigma-70 factor (ECF subfamily)